MHRGIVVGEPLYRILQAQFVENAGVQSARKTSDFSYSFGSDLAQRFSLDFCVLQLARIADRPQSDQQRGHQLTGFIVQFSSDSLPLLFLGLQNALQQQASHLFLASCFFPLQFLGYVLNDSEAGVTAIQVQGCPNFLDIDQVATFGFVLQ